MPRLRLARLAPTLLALLFACADTAPPTPAPPPHPLLVIGIDGATWDVGDPMLARGELPHFAALAERGVRGRLVCLAPLSSPVAWTTTVTGRFPRHHFVLDHTLPYRPGPKRPVTSLVRREPALWNVASDAGRQVAVVGWFATHPAEVVEGAMISDRAMEGAADGTWPPELAGGVARLMAELEEPAAHRRLLARFLPWPWDPAAVHDPGDPHHEASATVAGRIVRRSLQDEAVRRLTVARLAESPDVTLTYYRLIDHASHAAWIYYDPSDFARTPDPVTRELLADLVPATYRYMDEIVGELVARAGPETNVVVLSDHGFGSATGAWSGGQSELTGNHRPDGLLLAAGPDIAPAGSVAGVSNVDVPPLLYHLAGLPLAATLPGRLPDELLAGAAAERPPLRVDSYAVEWVSAGAGTVEGGVEAEALEALAALGYVEGSTAVAAEQESRSALAEVDFWEIDPRLRRRALSGELSYRLLRDQRDEARALLALVAERDAALLEPLAAQSRGEIEALDEKLGGGMFPVGAGAWLEEQASLAAGEAGAAQRSEPEGEAAP